MSAAIGLCVAVLPTPLLAAPEPEHRPKRAFTVEDAVGVAYFDNLSGRTSGVANDDGRSSPDGRWYLRLIHRGDVERKHIRSEVLLFRTADLTRFAASRGRAQVAPVLLASQVGEPNGGAWDRHPGTVIMQPRWSLDSSTIYYRAISDQESRALYSVDVESRIVTRLTPPGLDIVDYALTGSAIVLLAREPTERSETWQAAPTGVPAAERSTGRSLVDILFPRYRAAAYRLGTTRLYRLQGGTLTPIIDRNRGTQVELNVNGDGALFASPDGNQVIAKVIAPTVDPSWARFSRDKAPAYQRIVGDDDAPLRTEDGSFTDIFRPNQFFTINLRTRHLDALIDAPLDPVARDSASVGWSLDSRTAYLTGAFLPSGPFDGCHVARITIETRTAVCAVAKSSDGPPIVALDEMAGVSESAVLSATLGNGERRCWQVGAAQFDEPLTAVACPHDSDLRVLVDQTLNRPPALAVKASSSPEPLRFFDPNPQLKQIALGTVETFRWTDPSGRNHTAGLAKPPGYERDRRYPLIIQTHGFDPNRFMTTGLNETGYAARALAARGFVVLQVAEPFDHFKTPEGPRLDGSQVYLSAVDALSEAGIVDADRVGLLGWSYSGLYALQTLIDAPDRFKAAVLLNGDTGSLWQYLATVDLFRQDVFKGNRDYYAGAAPYGEGLTRWIETAPGFKLDRIRTPILLVAGDPYHLVYDIWPVYASLRELKKPVELFYLRDGQHNLTRVGDRLAVQQQTVDWFNHRLLSEQPAKLAEARP